MTLGGWLWAFRESIAELAPDGLFDGGKSHLSEIGFGQPAGLGFRLFGGVSLFPHD